MVARRTGRLPPPGGGARTTVRRRERAVNTGRHPPANGSMMPRMPPNDPALDEADIAELVRRFDAAAQAAGDEHEVLAHPALTVEEGQQAAGALATAFEYRLAVRQASGRRAETAFVPKFASPDGASYPSAVAEVPEEQC